MKFTEQKREKMKKARIKFIESIYDFEFVEPYLDLQINNGSRHRKYKFMTLREFKELKIDQRKTIKELHKEGYSLQILKFCSRFFQGMIKLSKDQLEKEYKIRDLNYISKKYKIDRGDMACLRQLYGINSTSGKYFKRIAEEKILTQRQFEILYGTMLGDACSSKEKRIRFCHGDCQRKYIFWKFDEFKEHCNPSVLKASRSISKKYKLDNICWRFKTKCHTEFEKCSKLFYQSGNKEVYKEVIEYLSSLSIAVWFMDDGYTNFNYKSREKTKGNIIPQIFFCTDSFSVKSCQLLIDCLKNKFNINSRLRKVKKLKNGTIPYNIIINKESAYDFFDLISPHIIPSMLYKIDYEEYKIWRKKKELLKEAENEKLLLTSE